MSNHISQLQALHSNLTFNRLIFEAPQSDSIHHTDTNHYPQG